MPGKAQQRLLAPALACMLAWFVAAPLSGRYAEANEGRYRTAKLEEQFSVPADAVKPWAYWWWLKGNVTEASITRDLEAMKRKGISGCLIFDARGYHEDHVPPPKSRMDFMGADWRKMFRFALSEADRLGLKASVNLSSCAGALKGPWLVGDDAPKKLVWCSLDTRGPHRLSCELPRGPAARSWDVALMAVRYRDSKKASETPNELGKVDTASVWSQWQPFHAPPDPKRLAVEVVDLSEKVDESRRVVWDVPAGCWTLVCFGCVAMEGHEYDVDILDASAVEGHFRRIGEALLEDAGPLAGKTLTHFYSVSWEGAIPTWTPAFDEQFRKYRGYRARRFLPVLAGITVEDAETSARFLRDYYKTLGDCFRDNFYGKLRALSNRKGIKWHSESGGPWNRKLSTFKHADQLAFLARNDMPQGEFWYPYRGLNKPPANAAHIYGLPLAATEAFTHMRTHWSVYPALDKGYAYDLINTEVLLTRLSVEDGDLVLPEGMRYRVLVVDLDDETVDPQALAKIVELAEAGATIVLGQRQPIRAPGLQDFPRCDEQVRRLAARLWPETDELPHRRALDRGEVIFGSSIDEVLKAKGISRDFEAAWDYLHRRSKDLDVYFVAGSGQAECVFRTGGREPELWDPITGRIRDAVHYRRTEDGRTIIPLCLPTNGSVLVVFRAPRKDEHLISVSASSEAVEIDGRSQQGTALQVWRAGRYELMTSKGKRLTLEVASLPEPKSITGPWKVDFTPGWGAPASVVFDKLIPWNDHPLHGIRYFSGTGGYRTTFRLNARQANSLVRLQLGRVENIAQVRVNGSQLGVVWTAPWAVDLTGVVKSGQNELPIDVTNLWVNRLVGDTQLPPEQRLTGTNVRLFGRGDEFRVYQGFSPDTPLMPSGLIGPVQLQFGTRREVPY